MSKAMKIAVGQVVKNHQGHFAKVIELKNGFAHFAGWFPKQKTAKDAENATAFLNSFGMARAIGEGEVIFDTKAPKAKTPATSNDEAGDEGNDSDDTTDPYDGVTVPQLRDALKDAELNTTGNRPDLVARCTEAGIEFEEETE